MQIEGPLTISVQDDETSMKRELHLSFKRGFVRKELFERTEEFQTYIDRLNHNLSRLAKDNPDRLAIETVLEICENLRENIAKDEIDLDETIVIEIQPSVNITNIITGGPTIN